MAINTYGKSTRRQLLEDQIANSQRIMNQAQNTDMFGSGRAGAFGAIAQGLTAGIGAYGQIRAKQQLLQQEAEDISAFSEFATAQGNPELASIAARLSPETREAYLVNKSLPAAPAELPASVKEYQYFTKLPKSEQTQFLRSQGKLTENSQLMQPRLPTPPSGYKYTQTGDLEAIPGGPAAKLSAESAGKVALIKQGEKDVERFKNLITEKDGSFNRTKLAALGIYGSPGARTEKSTLYNAVNARLRLESGAAVPESEVKRAMDSFAPKATDSDATINSKLGRMNEFFGLAKEEIGQGRGAMPVQSITGNQTQSGFKLLNVRDK